jgi:hypothetical protein
MAEKNGTTATQLAMAAAIGIPGVNSPFTPERIRELLALLSEPFDAELVEWRVTSTARGGKGLRGQVVAYADQRAYTDRLNALFTPLGWTREYAVQTVQNFEMPRKGQGDGTIITAKVMVTCKVTIYGLGTHAGTGEEWATDDNALTRAEAQAFKRACSCFGLGRYFYDLPRTWVDLDDQKRPVVAPTLPDWARGRNGASARPKHHRNGTAYRCPANQESGAANGSSHSNGTPAGTRGVFSAELGDALQALSAEVGTGLTRYALQRVCRKATLAEVRNHAHLTALLEKLNDLARGVRRLKDAAQRTGIEVHASICRDLQLPSASVDDIPDRTTLRELVEHMEAAAFPMQGA